MKRFFSLAGVLLAVAAVAAAACMLTMRMTRDRSPQTHSDAHQWIHTQLGLSADQEKQLSGVERHYDEQKKHLGELIRLANMELAQALLTDKGDSPRVKAATSKIKEAQGQLQDTTLQHVFEMKPILRAEQYEKLLNLTANALYQVNHAP